MAMDSLLRPALADLFLSVMDKKLNDCIAKVVLSNRFADDILIFTDSTNFFNILKLFNSTHPPLNFPVLFEEQANRCFNFLGIKLMIRSNGIIKLSIHRKAA